MRLKQKLLRWQPYNQILLTSAGLIAVLLAGGGAISRWLAVHLPESRILAFLLVWSCGFNLAAVLIISVLIYTNRLRNVNNEVVNGQGIVYCPRCELPKIRKSDPVGTMYWDCPECDCN